MWIIPNLVNFSIYKSLFLLTMCLFDLTFGLPKSNSCRMKMMFYSNECVWFIFVFINFNFLVVKLHFSESEFDVAFHFGLANLKYTFNIIPLIFFTHLSPISLFNHFLVIISLKVILLYHIQVKIIFLNSFLKYQNQIQIFF